MRAMMGDRTVMQEALFYGLAWNGMSERSHVAVD